MSAAIRITPTMIDALKKKLMGTPEDSPKSFRRPLFGTGLGSESLDIPQNERQVNVPVIGDEPDSRLSSVIRSNNLSSPPSIAATSAQMPSADQIQTAPIINKSLFDARTANAPVMPAPSINSAPVISRNPFADAQPSLADKYLATAQPYDEPSNAPVIAASRERRTQPDEPMIRASENYNAAMSSQPFFGTDKEGNIKTHADKGLGGRFKAGLKRFGYGMLRGEGVLGAGADAVEGAINPDINAIDRLHQTQATDAREYGNQIQLANEQAKLGQIKAATDYTLQRPAIAAAQMNAKTQAAAIKDAQTRVQRNLTLKRGQKLDPNNPQDAALLQDAEDAGYHINPDEWNNSARNEVTVTKVDPDNPTQTIRVSLNRVTGEEKVLGQAGYVQPVNEKTGMTPAQTTNAEIQREGLGIRREGVDIQREGLGIRQGEVSRQDQEYENRRQGVITANADIDRQITEKKKDQAGNERLANDANASAYDRDQAGRRARQIRDQIGRLERQKKAIPAERSMGTQGTSQAAPRSKTLQRMDSSSMDNQVKSHFDKGGKAIKVRDVKTGKETLVDNYNDYLVAIGRK